MANKILLLQMNVEMQDTAIYVNHGLASIAGVLRAAGHHPEIMILDTDSFSSGKWLERASTEGFIMAGISVYSNQWQYAITTAENIRRNLDIPVIGGGPHCCLFPESLAQIPAFNAFVVGEGEGVIGELAERAVHKKPFTSLPGVWCRNENGEVMASGAAPIVKDLNSIVEPAYDLYKREIVLSYPGLMFTRGCPYSCSYCCNEAYRRRIGTTALRFLSPERALQRAERYADLFRPPYLNFDDDTFTKNPKWMSLFLDGYVRSIGLPFNCNARPETINPEVCRILKERGCDTIALGCESGDEYIRRTVLNRKMNDDVIIRAADNIRAAGLKLATFNMVGLPGEKWPEYWKTVSLNRRLSPEKVQMTIYFPFRGTSLGDSCYEKGLVRDDGMASSYFAKSILMLPGFPSWQIRIAQRAFKFFVFIKTAPAKACFELFKDIIKSFPFGHRLVSPWLRVKRILIGGYRA